MLQLLFSILVLILIFYISPTIGAILIVLLILGVFLAKSQNNDETMPEEQETAGEDYPTDNGTDYDDFPEPDFGVPDMIPDPHTCLNFVAKYEDLAEQARDCGHDDLAEKYESAADHWRCMNEEAEDEEMEW